MAAHDWTYDHMDAEDGLQLLTFSDDEDEPVLFERANQASPYSSATHPSVSHSTPYEGEIGLTQIRATTSGPAYFPSFSHASDIITFSDDDDDGDAPLPNTLDASIGFAAFSTTSAHSGSSPSSSHRYATGSSSGTDLSTAATSKAPDDAADEMGEGMSDGGGPAGFERLKASEIAAVLADMETREIEYDPDMTEEQRR